MRTLASLEKIIVHELCHGQQCCIILAREGMGCASLESLKHMSELVNFESEVLGAI